MKPLLFGLATCAVSIVLASPSLAGSGPFEAGDGSIEHPYQIANVDQLQDMDKALDAHYVLVADIDASSTHSGSGFRPIGVFTGTLDGQNHTITDLYMNHSTGPVGMFGYVAAPAKIKSVRLENVDVIGGWTATGGLAGKAIGFGASISSCQTTGTVFGYSHVGGLVGDCLCEVTDCHSSCKVTAWQYVGGLVGSYFDGQLSSSYATGSVTGKNPITDEGGVGGLVGYGAPRIVDCYATGSVTGIHLEKIGGLFGILEGTGNPAGPVSRCYSTGVVKGGNGYVGGLIGKRTAKSTRVELSAWDVETSGQSTSAGGVGLTTKEMQDRATYGTYWDFAHTWDMISGLTYPFLQGDNPYFVRYGSGCAGPLLYTPILNAAGSPDPYEITLEMSRGVPSGFAALFVSPTRVEGECLLFGAPFFGPFLFLLDDDGEATLSGSLHGTTPGDRLVLQFLSVGRTTPQVWDASNGLQILVP
jgi:hypothetical protein